MVAQPPTSDAIASDLLQVIQTNVRSLPLDQQQQVLDFVEFLAQKMQAEPKKPGALSKLKKIKIQAPSDFARNLDQYLSGERTLADR
jgi:hypothetical protein